MIVHPAMPIMMALLAYTHGLQQVCVMIGVLMLHEAAHALAAYAVGVQIEQIEWMPFGGAVRLEGFQALSGWRGAIIAAAGPAVNLLTIMICASLVQYGMTGVEELRMLVKCSAALMLINLLPVLPLDGGRMLCALLSGVFSEGVCRRMLSFIGGVVGCIWIALGVWQTWRTGQVNMTLFLAGSYFVYAAANEYRIPWYRQIEKTTGKMRQILCGDVVRLREIVACEEVPLYRLTAKFSPHELHRIVVADGDGKTTGEVTEQDILRAMLENPAQRLKEVLEAHRKS